MLRRTLLLSFAISATAVLSGADRRVYVEFAAHGKGAALGAVRAAGGLVHHEFDDLGAAAVSVPEQAMQGLSHNPNITAIEDDAERYLFAQQIPYGIPMVQAPEAVAAGATGAGIKVGVIDTGVFHLHQDLQAVSIAGSPDFGPNDQRTWYRDLPSHGTHVTGIIAAANNSLGVLGVSPGAVSIYMVKVFGDSGNWVYSSDLVAAVRTAVNNGARVINMSLGGPYGNSVERRGLDKLYSGGTLLIAAAGNGGTTDDFYPASYDSVVSVAAINSNMVVASFSQKNSQVELAAPGVDVLSTTSSSETVTAVDGATTYQGNQIEFARRGTATGQLVDGGLATSTNVTWSGKVVLVQRGTNSFLQKVQNVQNSGGIAAIIYNNVAGSLLATLGSGNTSAIPAIGLSDTQGLQLKNSALGHSITVTSTVTNNSSGYAEFDGTSMATPHVVGVAALIWSKYPAATPAHVRAALTTSALDLGVAGRDTSYGFGLVQAKDALDTLAALVGGGGGGGDTTAPVISGVASAILNAKNGQFQITWTTDDPSTSVVTIGASTFSDSALVTNHVIKIRGKTGTSYQYSVTSTNSSNLTSTAGPFTHQN